jgi:hypothetical protein
MATQLLRESAFPILISMTLTNESPRPPAAPQDQDVEDLIESRRAFCLSLKAARERRGLSLKDIAEVTKVCVSHFVALERNDLRRWPKGIFRRAFFRGYVERIGLPVAETLDEFIRLFPDGESPQAASTAVAKASPLRLGLDTSWHGPKTPIRRRLATAAIDAALIAGLVGLAWFAGAGLTIASAVASLAYFTVARILVGDSPAAWAARAWASKHSGEPHEAALETETAAQEGSFATEIWQHVSDFAGATLRRTGDDHGAERQDARAKRLWTSDARRIRPREDHTPPRVRLKWPAHGRAHH